MQTKDEIIYTYQRVFKYLLETLSKDEFELLSFYNVNGLIDTIFSTKANVNVAVAKGSHSPREKPTLREFVYAALDLSYVRSPASGRHTSTIQGETRLKRYITSMYAPKPYFDPMY
jgi:hypothetical protein